MQKTKEDDSSREVAIEKKLDAGTQLTDAELSFYVANETKKLRRSQKTEVPVSR